MSGTGSSWDPRQGTLGQMAGGNWGNVGNQIQGGWSNQIAPGLNHALSSAADYSKNTVTNAGEGGLAGMAAAPLLGGDPLTGYTLGAAGGTLYNNYNTGKTDANQLGSDITASLNQNPYFQQAQQGVQGQQAQATQTGTANQNAKTTQQDQAKLQNSQNTFQEENSLEDALRAAQLKKSGQNANANFY